MGGRIAAGVFRRITESGPGDAELVRFEDQADYVAHFLADLVDGNASGRWYYGAFRYLDSMGVCEAATRVLLDNRDHLSAILVRLVRCGTFGRVMAALDTSALRELWFRGLRGHSVSIAGIGGDALELFRLLVATGRLQWSGRVDAAFLSELDQVLSEMPWLDSKEIKAAIARHLETEGSNQPPYGASGSEADAIANKDRALFDQACRLIDALGLWVSSSSSLPSSRDALFAEYRPRVIPDWQDARALTQSVGDVLRFLAKSGQLRTFDGSIPADFLPRLEEALEAYDWLDTLRLRTLLLELLTAQGSQPQRPRSSATPRQLALIGEMSAVLAEMEKRSTGAEGAEGRALRLYAALVDHFSHWKDDTLALRLIEGLAYAQEALGRSSARGRVLTALHSGAVDKALAALPKGTPSGAREGLRLLGTLGPEAVELLEDKGIEVRDGSYSVETRCAGAFLLLRAIADLRLPVLTEGMAYPPAERVARPGSWLVPLISRLAGVGKDQGEIDPGLAVILDGDSPPDWEGLCASWSVAADQDHERFQSALLRVLAGQRLVNSDRLHVYAFCAEGNRPTLIGGDELGRLWPLGRVLEDWSSATSVVEHWVRLWSEHSGRVPAEVVVDASSAASARFPVDLAGAKAVWQAAAKIAADIMSRRRQTQADIPLRLVALEDRFGLTSFDIGVLLVCLLPQLDGRYRRLYGYLQDDASRSRPNVKLIMQILQPLLSDDEVAHSAFNDSAPLRTHHLLHITDPVGANDPLSARALHVDARILDFLLGGGQLDGRLKGILTKSDQTLTFDDLLIEGEQIGHLRSLADWIGTLPPHSENLPAFWLSGISFNNKL
jgi:hypothetical protein